LDRDQVAALALDPLVGHLAGQDRDVAGEGRVAVLGGRVGDEAPLAGPAGDEVDDPGAHRRPVAVAPGHADVLRPPGLEVAAGRWGAASASPGWPASTRRSPSTPAFSLV